jgi:sensor histidine kinase YesM
MEFVNSMPDDIRHIYLKIKHADLLELFNMAVENNKYDEMFLIDVDEQHFGLVLGDHSSANEVRVLGDRCDLDLSKHPALDNILKNNSDNIEFERSDDFPRIGDYYIAYRPVKVDGKVKAVMGIVYNWESLRSAMSNSMLKAHLLAIGGILLAMVILLIVLYRRSIKPLTKIQSIVCDYTKNKNSADALKRTAEIKELNEFGLLSDDISEMVKEIDHFTEENIRIAAEKERAEKELYEAQVSVMVSQIQPHFMYNALSSIAMMCEIDPEKAQEATVAFADYLRGNMDSLKQKAPVPFTAELEHLKNYLAIEKLRFGRKLNIEYDIQTSEFVLPSLSIQPLVENSVKHGVGQKKKGGTVTISTRETETAFEVIISDDGVGFDVNAPKKNDGRSHVGMENTKKRLKDLCGAEVITESVIGEGTTTRVILPKEGQKHEDNVL